MAAIPENLRHRKAAFAALEILLSVIALLLLVTYSGQGTVVGKGEDGEADFIVSFSYPFVDAHWTFSGFNTTRNGTVAFHTAVKPSAQFVLATSAIGLLVALIRIILYMALGDNPRSQVVPPMEMVATSFLTILYAVAGGVFAWQVRTLPTTVRQALDVILQDCTGASTTCLETLASYAALHAAVAFMLLSSVAWGVNIWLAFRNTYLHKPYYINQAEAGEGPGAREIPTTSLTPRDYGAASGGGRRGSAKLTGASQFEPKEMTTIPKLTSSTVVDGTI